MQKQKRAERYTKRLEAEFSGSGQTHKGFVSNVSETGLFIRTSRSFKEGSPLEIKLYLPEGRISRLKGIVRRAISSEVGASAKNGMGIEITESDPAFIDFLRDVGREVRGEKAPPRERPGALMLKCPACGATNRVPAEKLSLGPRCGACRAPLAPEERTGIPKPEERKFESVIIACPACGAKNRVPAEKLSLGPRCGGCREPLRTG